MLLILILCSCCLQNFLICKVLLILLVISLYQLIKYLAFLQAAMSNGRQHGIPITEAILVKNRIHILRLGIVGKFKALALGILSQHFLAFQNIIFLQLFLKPLIDLVLRLGTLYHLQPVTAWSLGVLGSDDLNTVTILDPVLNGNQLAVYTGAYHLVSYSTMYAVRKVNRGRTVGKGLYISLRGKAVYTVRKQIQVILKKAHELFIVGHVPLPLQDLAQPV